MIIQLHGIRYAIGFQHSPDMRPKTGKTSSDWKGYIPEPRSTTCYIKQFLPSGELEVVAEGVSLCNPKDQFCKAEGRKRSLARALDQLFPENRIARRSFWGIYHRRRMIQQAAVATQKGGN